MKRLDIFCQNCYTRDIMEYTTRLKFYLYISINFSKAEADTIFNTLARMREEILKQKKGLVKHFSMSHFLSDLN